MTSPTRTTPRRALLRLLLPALTALATLGHGAAARASDSPGVDARERAVVDRVNAVRAQHGLAPLTVERKLSRAADRHSRRMARARVLAHRVWGEGTLAGRLRWASGGARVGEVIFWGRGGASSAEMVRAWMDSPGHRELLLSAGFERAGIGTRRGGGGIYATLDLAGR